MVGSSGKRKAAASRSKAKKPALSHVEPEPEPLVVEECVHSSSDDGEEIDKEISFPVGSSVEEESDEMNCEPADDDGHQEADHVNYKEDGTANEMAIDYSMDFSVYLETEENPNGLSEGAVLNNMCVEEIEEWTNIELPESEPVLGCHDVNNGEDLKTLDTTIVGDINADEGLAGFQNNLRDENPANDLPTGEGKNISSKEPAATPLADEKRECPIKDVSGAENVEEVPEEVNSTKSKRRLVKTVLLKKQPMLGNDAGVGNEATPEISVKNDAPGEADTSMVLSNVEKAVPSDKQKSEGTSEGASISAVNDVSGVAENHDSLNDQNKAEPVRDRKIGSARRRIVKKVVVKKKPMSRKDVGVGNEKNPEFSVENDSLSKASPTKVVNNDEKAVPSDENKSEGTAEGASITAVNGVADKIENVNDQDSADPVGDRKIVCETGLANIPDTVKLIPEKNNKPKRKLIRKGLAKKNMMLENSGVSVDEAKLQTPIDSQASGQSNKAGTSDDVKNEWTMVAKSAGTTNKTLKRIRRQGVSKCVGGKAATSEVQNSKHVDEQLETEDNKDIVDETVKNEESAKSEDKMKKQKAAVNDARPSKKKKSLKKVNSMGMIFMCSSETKKDCFRYNVLGLPANKKDIVSKIYKGMRLFLFDFKLRMMYGIYKAASPGGYNLESEAFKSQFPSQVRFTVLEDCLPLAEEKFRKVIKENYYTNNKFNCQLTQEQVKNLCKLFRLTSKNKESIQVAKHQKPVRPPSAKWDRKRKQNDDRRREGHVSSSNQERSRKRTREEARRPHEGSTRRPHEESARRPHEGSTRHLHEESARRPHEGSMRHVHERTRRPHEVRRSPVVIDDRYHRHYSPVYKRETYLPPAAPAVVYQPLRERSPPHIVSYSHERDPRLDIYRREAEPLRSLSYSYERDSRMDIYNRAVPLERSEVGLLSSRDLRRPVEPILRDSYVPYAEPQVYREPAYETNVRREHYDYTSVRQPVEYYSLSDDHRAPLPPHRRY